LGIHWDHELPFFDTIQTSKSEWQYGYYMEMFAIAVWKYGNKEITRSSGVSLLPSILGGQTSQLL
jgi:hypothetical protein